MANFFIRRPIVSIVIAICYRQYWRIHHCALPIASFSEHCPRNLVASRTTLVPTQRLSEQVCGYAEFEQQVTRRTIWNTVFRKHHNGSQTLCSSL